MNASNTILVTAATWYIGQQTISAIKNKCPYFNVCAGVYNKSKKIDKTHLWKDADQTYHFDANQPETINFGSFNVVCIIPSTNSSRLIQVSNMIDACKHSANNPFVIFCTIADPLGYGGEIAKSTRHMEAMVETSGLKYVIINCGFFHQNFEWNIQEMTDMHKICLPIGNGRFAPVDARDAAHFIATVLKDFEHYEGKQYNLVGQQLLEGKDAASIASNSLGYSIDFEDIPEANFYHNLKTQGCSDGMAKSLSELCTAIKKHDLEQTITDRLLRELNNRVITLREYLDHFSRLYGAAQTIAGAAGKEAMEQVSQPEGWEVTIQTDEGFAEAKEERRGGVESGWGELDYQYSGEEQEDWGEEEADRDQNPDQNGELEETYSSTDYGRKDWGGWGLEEKARVERPVRIGEGWELKNVHRDQWPVQYDFKKWEGWGANEADRDQRSTQYGREARVGEAKEAGRDQRPAQYGREEWGWGKPKVSGRAPRPAQYGKSESGCGTFETQNGGEQQQEWGTDQADRGQKPVQYVERWRLKEADRDLRRPAKYGREVRGQSKSKEADLEKSERRKATKTTPIQGEDVQTGKALPQERVVAIERDIYYLKPQTEERFDSLQRAQRDYEQLSRLLSDTINDLNAMFKNRKASLTGDKRLVKTLEGRKNEIDKVLCQLNREIQDQERGPAKRRPHPTLMPIGMHLVSENENLEEGTRRTNRPMSYEAKYESYGQRARTRYPEERMYPENRIERYHSPRREAEFVSYRQSERARSEERRIPEKRRERRSASTTHLGRELAKAKGRTMLGRELNSYKGENFISKISRILYGWKDKGERKHGSRDFEGGERYRHEIEVYGYREPRRESVWRERRQRDLERKDREREERRRRGLEQQDRELKERRRRDFERQEREEREYEERDYRREKLEHSPERPREYGEPRPESRKTSKVSFVGKQERYGPKYRKVETETRAHRRESGYGSDLEEYVWIPKDVLKEAVRY